MGPALTAVAAAAFLQAFVRLRGRGRRDLAGWDRALLFTAALVLWTLALSPPVDELADRLLAGHMLEHVLIADAVPALVLVAVRGPLLFFLVPPALLRRVARLRRVRACVALLLRPAVAFVVWAGSLAVWHIPALYDLTLESESLHVLEHGTFVLGGTLVWLQLIDPARRAALGPNLRLGYAFAVFVGSMALANALLLTYSPLYPAYAVQEDRPFGLTALGDQELAGLVMLAEQVASLGTFAAIMLRRMLRAPLAAGRERHPLAA